MVNKMKNTTEELTAIIEDFSEKLARMPESEFSQKPLPHKWSKKEVLGHLIDSAHNNLRRFICGQYEPAPPKIVYDQDFWVAATNYQGMSKETVISLWKLMNGMIVRVLDSMPASHYGRACDTGRNNADLHSLEWLAGDYVKHLKHHLNQIVAGSFDIVYVSR